MKVLRVASWATTPFCAALECARVLASLWEVGKEVKAMRRRLALQKHFVQKPGGLCRGTRLHQPQAQHVKSGKERDHQEDPTRLSMNKTHQRLRARQKLRLKAISFVAEVSQDRAPKRGTGDGDETENSEVHPNNPRRDRNQMADYRKQAGKKNSARLVAGQPMLGALQFLFTEQHETAVSHNERAPDEPRCPICDG